MTNKRASLLTVLVVVFTITTSAHGQTLSQYHPPYSNGKWSAGSITCHVVPYMVEGENIARKIFDKAAAAWNAKLNEAGIALQIVLVDANQSDSSLIGNKTSNKNLLGISKKLEDPMNAFKSYGTTDVLDSTILATSQGTNLLQLTQVHVTISESMWLAGRMTLGKEGTKPSVYAVATHELGHLLGFHTNHDVPNKSVMSSAWTKDLDDFSNSNITLDPFDVKLLKAMYPTIHPNFVNGCMPRR